MLGLLTAAAMLLAACAAADTRRPISDAEMGRVLGEAMERLDAGGTVAVHFATLPGKEAIAEPGRILLDRQRWTAEAFAGRFVPGNDGPFVEATPRAVLIHELGHVLAIGDGSRGRLDAVRRLAASHAATPSPHAETSLDEAIAECAVAVVRGHTAPGREAELPKCEELWREIAEERALHADR